jgi:predicted RNA-binding protein with PUA-like domain
MKQYWLMKSEPDTFGIADLARVKVEPWSGVRSMFARFHMRQMNVGDEVLFHHSSCNPPGVAGLARVVRTKVIDETQFDPQSPYFDEKATREKPIWDCVDVEYVSTFPHLVSMERLRADPALADMVVLKQGRLSVQPVQPHEFARIVELGQIEPPPAPPKPPRKKAKAKAKAKAPKAKAKAKKSSAKQAKRKA